MFQYYEQQSGEWYFQASITIEFLYMELLSQSNNIFRVLTVHTKRTFQNTFITSLVISHCVFPTDTHLTHLPTTIGASLEILLFGDCVTHPKMHCKHPPHSHVALVSILELTNRQSISKFLVGLLSSVPIYSKITFRTMNRVWFEPLALRAPH